MRRHLTYANVVSTICLFLLIGGGAAIAARALKKDSVKSKQIAAGAVKKSELADGAVSTGKLADSAATGAKVDEASLGKVPSAVAADAVGGRSAAQLRTTSAFVEDGSIVTLDNTYKVVASGSIATESAGRVMASGSAELQGIVAGDGNTAQCLIDIDGTSSLLYEGDSDDVGMTNQFVIAVEFARSLPAGVHTVSLECKGLSGSVQKDDAAINVLGVPD